MADDFDPDAYLSGGSDFDPDAYLGVAPKPPQTPVPQTSVDDAIGMGMGQALFGMGDELAAGMKAVKDTALTPERRWGDLLQLYRANKKNAQRDISAAQSQHPVAYMYGNLPTAAATGMASAALAPAAAMQAAPWGANAATNVAQSVAQNFGQDSLSLGNVAKDVAFGEGLGGAMRVAARGPVKAVGDIMQLPQRGVDAAADWFGGTKLGQMLGKNGDELGDIASKRVKDLRVTQQSYLTEAGKQAAEAEASIGGNDFPSRLAKATTEGRASVGPGPRSYSFNPAEFGDDIRQIGIDATIESARRFGGGLVDPLHESPVTYLKTNGLYERASDVSRDALRTIADEETLAVSNTQKILDQWRAAKAAQQSAQQSATEAAGELGRIQTGRAALSNVAGVLGGGAGGHAMGGPVGAMVGVASGKQLGKSVFKGVDLAGEAGQKLSQVASIAEKLAARDDGIGRAAQWALSAEGPSFVARLATLADLPEVQSELQTP